MGAMAEFFAEFARPLLESSDGTQESMQTRMMMAKLCYNLSLLPESERGIHLEKLRSSLGMSVEEFDQHRADLIEPMIKRGELLHAQVRHARCLTSFDDQPTHVPAMPTLEPEVAKPTVGRYDPCPCGSGEKYKFCCGRKK